MREYLTLHRSVFPSYLTIESGRMVCMGIDILVTEEFMFCNITQIMNGKIGISLCES